MLAVFLMSSEFKVIISFNVYVLKNYTITHNEITELEPAELRRWRNLQLFK